MKLYQIIEELAAEQGLTPSIYLKRKVEKEHQGLITDIELIKSDLKEILGKIENIASEEEHEENITAGASNENLESMLLETLLILRQIAPSQKLETAQKRFIATGKKPYNGL